MVYGIALVLALTTMPTKAQASLPADLEQRLVLEANRVFSRNVRRAVHAPPVVPGRFGDALVAHLPGLNSEFSRWTEDGERSAARDVWMGMQPWANVPASWAAAVDRFAPQLDGLLAGTHTERAALPPRGDITDAADGIPWMGLQLAAELTALRVRRSLAHGDAKSAIHDCLDGLALGRDAAITGLMIGRMVGVAAQSKLIQSCGAALNALPPAARHDAIRAVRAVRDAVPPMSATVRDDFFSMSLWTYGRSLSSSARHLLGPAARRVAETGAVTGPSAWSPEQLRAYWAFMERVAALLDQPRRDREAPLRRLDEMAPENGSPGQSLAKSYGRYALFADAATLRLDALVVAAVADLHARRLSVMEVRDLEEAGLLTRAEARRLADARLRRAADGTLEVDVPLPLPDGDGTLVLRIPPSR